MSESLEQKTNEEVTVTDSETVTSENSGTEVTEINDTGTKETTETTNNEVKKKSKKPLIIALSCVLAIIVIVGIILLVVLNSKSAEAKRVDSLISSIGTVTLDSEPKIIEAEKEVKALSKEDYNQLDNVGELEEARKTYDGLVKGKQAEEVENIINNIGEVNLSSESKIQEAKTAYNKLPEDVKSLVKNYNKIETAEKSLSQLKIQNVISLINDIGKVTSTSKEKISTARSKYNELTFEEQKEVTNYSALTNAESSIKTIVKEEITKKFNSTYDNVSGITVYTSKLVEQKEKQLSSYALPFLYIKDNGSVFLGLRIVYISNKESLYFNNIQIVADNQRFSRKCSALESDTDYKNGYYLELYAGQYQDKDEEWMSAVANSKECTIRLNGVLGNSYDLSLTQDDKNVYKEMLEAYFALKG